MRNPVFESLSANYLFQEIAECTARYQQMHPESPCLHLGIGNTTQPLPKAVGERLAEKALALTTEAGYSGYGDEQGSLALRRRISEQWYAGSITPEEIFITDGAKSALGRLQYLFASDVSYAVQNPTYPAYIDANLFHGRTRCSSIPCTPENDFFPAIEALPDCDIYYLCFPNNPTGTMLSRERLQEIVDFACDRGKYLLFDAAYRAFIRDDTLPKSIYEMDGAHKVAIEINSFSKCAGFTGLRLGFDVVPKQTKRHGDMRRIHSTLFNGASNIVQAGGLAVLEEGADACFSQVQRYMQSADRLKSALVHLGFAVYGGWHAPYLWVSMPGRSSWEAFNYLLERYGIVSIPGVGFGSAGEGFVRLSAFASGEVIDQAIASLGVSAAV